MDFHGHFSKEDTQRAQRRKKRCSASVASREMHIETTMRDHFTPVRTAVSDKSANNRGWRGCGERGALVHGGWERRLELNVN